MSSSPSARATARPVVRAALARRELDPITSFSGSMGAGNVGKEPRSPRSRSGSSAAGCHARAVSASGAEIRSCAAGAACAETLRGISARSNPSPMRSSGRRGRGARSRTPSSTRSHRGSGRNPRRRETAGLGREQLSPGRPRVGRARRPSFSRAARSSGGGEARHVVAMSRAKLAWGAAIGSSLVPKRTSCAASNGSASFEGAGAIPNLDAATLERPDSSVPSYAGGSLVEAHGRRRRGCSPPGTVSRHRRARSDSKPCTPLPQLTAGR